MTPQDAADGTSPRGDLSVVVVSWNVRDLLRQCLRSVRAAAGDLDVECIVVDNASDDDSAGMVRREFPGVRLVALARNVGFAAANNRGIACSRGRHVLALNPDVVVRPGALAAMVAKLDGDPTLGAVGARQLDTRGHARRAGRACPTFAAMLGQYTLLRAVPHFRRALNAWKMHGFAWDREREVDVLGGGCLMAPRRVLEKVGGWDERFFMFFEDVDLCRRIREAGCRVLFCAEAEVVHSGGRSARQASARERMLLTSMLACFDKHAGPRRTALFRLVFKPLYYATTFLRLPAEMLSALAQLVAGRPERARRRLRVVRRLLRQCTVEVWPLLGM
jgi:GT2 family glycosyltransferase